MSPRFSSVSLIHSPVADDSTLLSPTYQNLTELQGRIRSGLIHAPLLASLLLDFGQLRQLTVSAAELPAPAHLFASLSPRLFHLEIHSFNNAGDYGQPQVLIAAISDPMNDLGALRSLHVHNAPASWTARHVRTLAQRCAERDIVFSFKPE